MQAYYKCLMKKNARYSSPPFSNICLFKLLELNTLYLFMLVVSSAHMLSF